MSGWGDGVHPSPTKELLAGLGRLLSRGTLLRLAGGLLAVPPAPTSHKFILGFILVLLSLSLVFQ